MYFKSIIILLTFFVCFLTGQNIDLNPRQTHGETTVGDIKVRVLGESSADMKNRSFKIRKKN